MPARSRLAVRAAALLAAASAALAPAFAQAQTLLRDAEIERTLRDYSDPLFTAAGLVPSDIRIYLVGDRSLNAFVTGGQNVFLHTGLILEAETPNQLNGVIAHETGHIAGGHLARSSEAIQNAMVPAYVTIALGILALAAGAGDAGAALIASSQQFAMLSFFTYTRVQESSADQAAVGYLEASGQSGRGLVEFFSNFRYQEVLADARRAPYFRSHPLSTDRITALTRRVEEQEHKDVVDTPESIHRFRMMQAKIQGFMATPAQTFAKYPATDTSVYARYARAIAAYRAPDLTTAVALTNQLIADEPDNPWFHELLGQMLYEHGQAEDSIAPNQRAVDLAPNESLLRIGLARSLVSAGSRENMAEAEVQLRAALRLEPDNAFAWNQMAIVADRRGDSGMARLSTAEEAYALGDAVRANRFSQAALRTLERGTPSWQRASDIEVVTAPIAARAARSQGGPVTGRRAPRQILPIAASGASAVMASTSGHAAVTDGSMSHDGHVH
jgi:predicted Zn-dependent protease